MTTKDQRFSQLDSAKVLAAGPTDMKVFAHDPVILAFLQQCYANAVKSTLYVALATAVVAVLFAMGMQWLNVKKVNKDISVEALANTENIDARSRKGN